MTMDTREIVRACMELTALAATLARVLAQLAQQQPERKPPARARVVEMPKAANQ